MNHFDEMAGLLYLEGQVDAARSLEIADHLKECGSCRELMRALQRETLLLSSALTEEDEGMPARLLGERVRSMPSWAWALASGVFAVGAYWLWTDGIGPWLDQLSNAGFGGTDLFSMVLFSGAFWEGWSDMIDAIQIGALIVLAILAVGWIRRRVRRPVAVAVVVAALGMALVLPQGASAADVRRGRSVIVPAGDVVHNDLVATAPSVRIDGTVEGDVIAFTRNLTVTGHVTGDVIGFAGETLIDGTVDGNVRIFTRSVVLQGAVAKNMTVFANSVDLTPRATVGGGVILFGDEVDLDGKIQRDLLGIAARTNVEGLIGGQAWVRGGSLTVESGAEIKGPATFEGPQEPVVESGAKLASPIQTEITQQMRRNRRSTARVAIRAVFGYAGALLVGILIFAVFPGFFRTTLQETNRIGLPIGIGVLALITAAFFVVAGVLLLFVGVGAGLAGALGFAPIVYVAQIFVGTWLGNKIMGEPAEATGAVAGRMAAGLLILDIARLIPILGGLVGFVVLLWGAGALLMAFYRMSRVATAPIPASV